MKNYKLIFFRAFMALIFFSAFTPQDCPPSGRADAGKKPLDEDGKLFNRKKNRSAKEPERPPFKIRIASLKGGMQPRSDRDYWQEGSYVGISDAFLIDYKPQGGETCYCGEGKARMNDPRGDIHINIGNTNDLSAENNNYFVVVEITPSYKRLNPDYAETLKSLKVKENSCERILVLRQRA